jgi:hypothetical protein
VPAARTREADVRDHVDRERAGKGGGGAHPDGHRLPAETKLLAIDVEVERADNISRDAVAVRLGLAVGDRAVLVGVERRAQRGARNLAEEDGIGEAEAAAQWSDLEITVVVVDRRRACPCAIDVIITSGSGTRRMAAF